MKRVAAEREPFDDYRSCDFVRRFRRTDRGLREVRRTIAIGGANATMIAWTPKTRFWRVHVRADLVPSSVIRLPRPGVQMALFA